jgi:short-subunit dehydrogenase
VIPVRSDLVQPEGVAAVWEAVTGTGRPLEVAVLNAGIAIGGAFTDVPLDRHLQLIGINVIAPVRLAYDIVPHMVARGRGQILFVSSLSATTPTPFETVYGPSKSFLTSFAHSLLEEIRGSGVTITTLHPGATATEFHARAGMGATKFGDNSWKNSPALVAQQGYDGMRRGAASVIGGDRSTKRAALLNRFLSDERKARRQARFSRNSH